MTVTYHRETHHSKCSKVFAFGFETCSKTISSLICRLIIEALLVADHISIRCHFSSWTSLVSDKHVPTFRFQSVSPGLVQYGVVFMQPAVKVNGTWDYYCDVLLLKQLLPYICQAAGDLLSSASRVHKSTELLRHKTPDFTPDVASQQTKPQFCRLDYRLLTVIQECVYQKQQGCRTSLMSCGH